MNILEATHAFAEPGQSWLIDMIHPETGRSFVNGDDLASMRVRHPRAEIVEYSAWARAKAEAQDEPGAWSPVTEDRYLEMLGVLPPAAMKAGAFLVGEPYDHHARSGQPRFACFRKTADGTHEEYSRPMTHAEFVALFGQCSSDYIS